MRLICSHCQEVLEYSNTPPRFCSHCGQAMLKSKPPSTLEYDPEAATLPPSVDPDADARPLLPDADLPSNAPDVPDVVGNYRLMRLLGKGGMGTVHEAEDISSGRRVALKLVLPEYAASREAVQRFRLEGQLASELSHPRCVFVLAADEDHGRPYIVMELMPGSTLHELVKEKGPLPPEDAVHKIIDVIEGLHEAHVLGLVHRDVKPSNCFLEPDGRVKVGDFGLAKSLVRDAQLTRTGTFLGTPLFAAPEQVKMEAVDAQSDVYSVAATLYYLLTGRAPFQTGDAMATLARIVSDDPPSLRSLRPEIPKALDAVVLRGLARDRKRRYRSMEEFRRALLPFLPAEPTIGDIGIRWVAWMIDWAFMQVVLSGAVVLGVEAASSILSLQGQTEALLGTTLGPAAHILYFALMEGILGWSLGKWLFRLRVCRVTNTQPPGVLLAGLRMMLLTALLTAGYFIITLPMWLGFVNVPDIVMGVIGGTVQLLCWLAIVVPMRKSNGYRGPHEWLSGTRVVRLPLRRAAQQPTLRNIVVEPLVLSPVTELPEQIGPYRVLGAIRHGAGECVLMGEDRALNRRVWLWLRPETEAPLPLPVREVSRVDRQRWLACGKLGPLQWDAFLPPTGGALPRLIEKAGTQPWGETRAMLEPLCEVIAAAVKEGSLPPRLEVEQIWIQRNGRPMLLTCPLASPSATDLLGDDERALELMRRAAVLMLEGRPRPPGSEKGQPISRPLPLHARRILHRLLDAPQETVDRKILTLSIRMAFSRPPKEMTEAYQRMDELCAGFSATQHNRAQITRGGRVWLIFLGALFCLIGLAITGGVGLVVGIIGSTVLSNSESVGVVVNVACLSAATIGMMVASFITRGGLSLQMANAAVVRLDGRKASRLRCVWRSIAVWLALGVMIAGGVIAGELVETTDSGREFLGLVLTGVLLVGYAAAMIWKPSRAPHDYLAGTVVVPD